MSQPPSVRVAGVSFRKLEWMSEGSLLDTRPGLVRAYIAKVGKGRSPVEVTGYEDGVHPEWRTVERIFAEREWQGHKQYYVKWFMLGYSESTWEVEEDLQSEAVRSACTDSTHCMHCSSTTILCLFACATSRFFQAFMSTVRSRMHVFLALPQPFLGLTTPADGSTRYQT